MASAPVASSVCSFREPHPLLAWLSSHSTSTTSPGFNATSTHPPICRVCEGPTVAVLRLPMLAHGCPVIDLSGGEHLQAVGARVELQSAEVEALALWRGEGGHAVPQTVASSCHLGRVGWPLVPPQPLPGLRRVTSHWRWPTCGATGWPEANRARGLLLPPNRKRAGVLPTRSPGP